MIDGILETLFFLLIFAHLVKVFSMYEREMLFILRRLEREVDALQRKMDLVLVALYPARAIEFYDLISGEKVEKMFVAIDTPKSFKIAIKDKAGNPAAVDGAPSWALSDPALGTLNVAADGMSCEVVSSGTLGACKIQVSADADLGAGVEQIFGEGDLEFIGGKAVTVEISEA